MGVIGRGVCGRVRNLCLVCFRSQGREADGIDVPGSGSKGY